MPENQWQLGNQATKWVVYVSRLTKHLAKTLHWKFLYLTETMLCWLLCQPLIRKKQKGSALIIRLCTDPCYEFRSTVSERRSDRDTLWCQYQCQHQLRCSRGSSTCRPIYWHNPETHIQRWHSKCILAKSSGLSGCDIMSMEFPRRQCCILGEVNPPQHLLSEPQIS